MPPSRSAASKSTPWSWAGCAIAPTPRPNQAPLNEASKKDAPWNCALMNIAASNFDFSKEAACACASSNVTAVKSAR
jgi:hypothetical protein